MFIWTQRISRAEAVGAPSPLLNHLAGDFAPRVAGLWPDPHRPFVEAASARRHLLCLALSRTEEQLEAKLAAVALTATFRRALNQLVPDAPDGLARALQRLGEVAWPAEGYERLLNLLGQPETCKLLRHADAISLESTKALAVLTPGLHRAGLGRAGLTLAQAGVLHELHIALAARDGTSAADAAARSWAGNGKVADILSRAERAIRRPKLNPPFPDTDRLRGLLTLAQIDEAGGRYKNCLATLDYVGDPDYAFYEWLGDPGVMVELFDDRLFGWTLWQASCVDNKPVPEPAREEISFALRQLGVHVGRGSGAMQKALSCATYGRPVRSIEDVIRGCFGG
jgi:hypothetical protein